MSFKKKLLIGFIGVSVTILLSGLVKLYYNKEERKLIMSYLESSDGVVSKRVTNDHKEKQGGLIGSDLPENQMRMNVANVSNSSEDTLDDDEKRKVQDEVKRSLKQNPQMRRRFPKIRLTAEERKKRVVANYKSKQKLNRISETLTMYYEKAKENIDNNFVVYKTQYTFMPQVVGVTPNKINDSNQHKVLGKVGKNYLLDISNAPEDSLLVMYDQRQNKIVTSKRQYVITLKVDHDIQDVLQRHPKLTLDHSSEQIDRYYVGFPKNYNFLKGLEDLRKEANVVDVRFNNVKDPLIPR